MTTFEGFPDKAQLRKQYLEKRRSLPLATWTELNTALLNQVRQLDFSSVRTIHTFLPIQRNAELDTPRIVSTVDGVAPQEIRWVISKTDVRNGALYHFRWDPHTPIRENKWGIPEPLGGHRIPEEEIDLVFVPLLIFDRAGHRVGYGKGYYDRFLRKCRPNTHKIGLSLFEPIEQIPDIYESDIPLDACVTPSTIHWFCSR